MNSQITLAASLLFLIHLLGIYNAVHVVMHGRTPQGAIAWSLSLIFLPYFAVPLYWIFGSRRFYQYFEVLKRSFEIQQQRLGPKEAEIQHEKGSFREPFDKSQQVLEALARWPITTHNRCELLIDGEEIFNRMFHLIREAKQYLLLEFYIVRDDAIGRELKSELIRACRRGIRVYFLFDQVGSLHLPHAYQTELVEQGAFVEPFRTTKGRWLNRFRLNFRNHRKLVVADGTEAIVGGQNIGDEYLGRDRYFRKWRDTALLITGPGVLGVQKTFVQDWYWVTETLPRLDWQLGKVQESVGGSGTDILTLATGPIGEKDEGELWLLELIQKARNSIWLATPYFVPTEAVMQALQLALLRGVEIRVLCPSFPDHILIYLAGQVFLHELVNSGAQVYRYKRGFMHQKVILVDQILTSIGTFNIDSRSMRLNFEISILSTDQELAARVRQMLEQDFAESDLMEVSSFRDAPDPLRFLCRVSRLFAPVL
jgi:cardiolipin synthase A/B